jgi:hypothetical protein
MNAAVRLVLSVSFTSCAVAQRCLIGVGHAPIPARRAPGGSLPAARTTRASVGASPMNG